MLDIASSGRVHLEALVAEQHDMGVCDAIEGYEPQRKPAPMSPRRPQKVAGIKPASSPPPHTAPASPEPRAEHPAATQDRMAEWITDLSSLQELTERLARTSTLDEALHELLRAGATLVGAQRGLVALEPTDGKGPERTVGLGL